MRAVLVLFILFGLQSAGRAGVLLVDIGGKGSPDLLCGPQSWCSVQPIESECPISDHRAVQLGRTLALWPWVGPGTALVVYSEKGPPAGVISGLSLVGDRMGQTGGKVWASAYKALARFDADKDGRVSGGELSDLYLWADLNSDGLASPDEVCPAATKVVSFSLLPKGSPPPFWLERGATLSGGQAVSTWEWSPARSPDFVDADGKPIPIVAPVYIPKDQSPPPLPPAIYNWVIPELRVSGFYRFFRVGESLWVATVGPGFLEGGLASVGEVFLDSDPKRGGPVSWAVSDGGVNWVRVEAVLGKDGSLAGTATRAKRVFSFKAVPMEFGAHTDNSLGSYLALPDSSLEQAILRSFPSRLLFPFGMECPNFSGKRSLLDF